MRLIKTELLETAPSETGSSSEEMLAKPKAKLEWYWFPVGFAAWFLLFYLVVVPVYYHLPTMISMKEEKLHPGEFIGERAERNLYRLASIGVKMVGSEENDIHAVRFLMGEIEKIKLNARTDLYDIEADVQVASGNFPLWGMASVYQGIQNVVVKLTPKMKVNDASLLLNTHFDSEVGSPGAGDAGIMCTVMLEVLRVLSSTETTLRHPIVFLFNGAEENNMQGSHAFITQHKWAKSVKALINLDSAGNGGKEILFQSGPNHPWLMKYYKEGVQTPFASTLGEEMFENDIIPSDTDFRIFRDFGGIPGLDMAHHSKGNLYHTKNDRAFFIESGSYQTTGNNVLGLVKAIANAPEMQEPNSYGQGHSVYYDFLGLFLVKYTERSGIIINIIVSVAGIAVVCAALFLMSRKSQMQLQDILKKFGIIFAVQLVSVVMAVGGTVLMGVIYDAFGEAEGWYYSRWLIFGLYFCPTFFSLGSNFTTFFHFTRKDPLKLRYRVQMILHAQCVILSVTTIILTCMGLRSAFVVMIGIFFYTATNIINLSSGLSNRRFLWLIPHVLGQVVPFLFYSYLAYTFISILAPMQARNGPSVNPEIFMGGMCAFLGVMLGGFIIPISNLFRKSRALLPCIALTSFLFSLIPFTPLGFPYRELYAPQRYYVLQTSRVFHEFDLSVSKADHGFFVMPTDRHPKKAKRHINNFYEREYLHEYCDTELFCGMPLVDTRWTRWGRIEGSYWIPGPAPNLVQKPKLTLLSKSTTSANSARFEFELSGVDHISIYIKPLANSTVKAWSFDKVEIDKELSEYFVYYSHSLVDPSPLKFFVEIQKNAVNLRTANLAIGTVGHLNHHEKYFNDGFNEFLDSFPKWAYPTAWMASYDSYEF